MRIFESMAQRSLEGTGITINGTKPYDIQVRTPLVYPWVFFERSLGFGEAYERGMWEVEDMAEMICRLVSSGKSDGFRGISGTLLQMDQIFRNHQSREKSRRVALNHYDLSAAITSMLGELQVYTCGYWETARSLEEAQEAKFERICRKLKLRPGQFILDIGCGYGTFLKYAYEHYGARGIGITLSDEQLMRGKSQCENLPIKLLKLDYRDLPKRFGPDVFDHVISIGMFEHVGPKNYRDYFAACADVMKKGPENICFVHTIGGRDAGSDPWLEKYIFPGGWIPTLAQIDRASKEFFTLYDVENFGSDYDRTLCAWWENFDRAWPELQAAHPSYDDRFYRVWRYYLLSCAGAFRANATRLWQIVFKPTESRSAYRRPQLL